MELLLSETKVLKSESSCYLTYHTNDGCLGVNDGSDKVRISVRTRSVLGIGLGLGYTLTWRSFPNNLDDEVTSLSGVSVYSEYTACILHYRLYMHLGHFASNITIIEYSVNLHCCSSLNLGLHLEPFIVATKIRLLDLLGGIMELSFPRTFAPGSESSIGGTFVPWNFRSLELSFPGAKTTWNFRSLI